eukprot:5277426-Pyramimonas_sp.AAC.1
MSAVGSRKQVQIELVTSVVSTAAKFKEHGLQLATKRVVLCSDHGTAKVAVQQLKLRGVEVQPVLQAADLGVDQGMGKRLARTTRRLRVAKGGTQNQKLRKYAHAARRYRVTKRLGSLDLRLHPRT